VEPGEATSSSLEARKYVVKWSFKISKAEEEDNVDYTVEDFEDIGVSATTVLSALVTAVSKLRGSVRDLYTANIRLNLEVEDSSICVAMIGKYIDKVAIFKMYHRKEIKTCKVFIARMMLELDESKEQLLLELGAALAREFDYLDNPLDAYAALWVEVEYPVGYNGDVASIARTAIRELAVRVFDVISRRG